MAPTPISGKITKRSSNAPRGIVQLVHGRTLAPAVLGFPIDPVLVRAHRMLHRDAGISVATRLSELRRDRGPASVLDASRVAALVSTAWATEVSPGVHTPSPDVRLLDALCLTTAVMSTRPSGYRNLALVSLALHLMYAVGRSPMPAGPGLDYAARRAVDDITHMSRHIPPALAPVLVDALVSTDLVDVLDALDPGCRERLARMVQHVDEVVYVAKFAKLRGRGAPVEERDFLLTEIASRPVVSMEEAHLLLQSVSRPVSADAESALLRISANHSALLPLVRAWQRDSGANIVDRMHAMRMGS